MSRIAVWADEPPQRWTRRWSDPSSPHADAPPTSEDCERLVQRVVDEARRRGYSRNTVRAYAGCLRRFQDFYEARPVQVLTAIEVAIYVDSLRFRGRLGASTRNQALSALRFLYGSVLGREIAGIDAIPRSKGRSRQPCALTPAEVQAVLDEMGHPHRLVCSLMYASGLRLIEALRIRIHDVDPHARRLTVNGANGERDRTVPLPESLSRLLVEHIARLQTAYDAETDARMRTVPLPARFARRGASTCTDWTWQWVFPGRRPSLDPRSHTLVRMHLHESAVQREFHTAATVAQVGRPATAHALRDSFAMQMLKQGLEVRQLQRLMGHSGLAVTLAQALSLQRPRSGSVRSPFDLLRLDPRKP